jgi:amino acid transporter
LKKAKSPPRITARRGGGVTKKMARSLLIDAAGEVFLVPSIGTPHSCDPTGGGSYTVAHQNVGVKASLFAGAALMLDYILNVAVAISAGIGALISVVPKLQPHTVSICLGVLLLLTVINLRGIKETSFVFLIPTWLFVGCLGIVIAIGMFKIFWSGQSEAVSPRPLVHTPQAVSLWLVIRAFASGCTALTGVEAVSNGVKAFREPVVESARRTLAIIIFILVGLLAGIAFLVNAYQIVATPPGQPGYDSVLSQLSRAVAGNGVFYKFTMGGNRYAKRPHPVPIGIVEKSRRCRGESGLIH